MTVQTNATTIETNLATTAGNVRATAGNVATDAAGTGRGPRHVETCPLCSGTEVQVEDLAWFAIELDRRPELDVDDVVVFSCRQCGVHWD